MKIITKIALIAALTLPVGASITAYTVTRLNADSSIQEGENEEEYILEKNGYRFVLNGNTLKFQISKGTKVWDSGTANPLDCDLENPVLSPSNRAIFESPVSLYQFTKDAGDGRIYPFLSVQRVENEGIQSWEISPGNNKVTITQNEDNIKARVRFLSSNNLKVSFNLTYRLIDDGLKISITNLEEDPFNVNYLSKIQLYPGFGSTYKLSDGYFLIPDGSGALIDTSVPTNAKSELSLRTYGNDIGLTTSSRTINSGEQLAIPMFANVDTEKSMIATIESGEEYSELKCRVNGISDNYNTSYFNFIYRDRTYRYSGVSEDESNRMNVVQEKINPCEPSVHYHLYDEKLEYYELAQKYQEYLLGKHLLSSAKNSEANLRLEFLMSENKKALFGQEVFKMTSVNFIKNKMEELSSIGDNFTVSLKGYTQGGYGNSYPNAFPLEGKTGSGSDYKNLADTLSNRGIKVNYNVDLVRSFSSNSSILAMNYPEKNIVTNDYVNGSNVKFYRINPKSTASLLSKYEKNLNTYHGNGFDFNSLGYELFSTYHRENNTRSETKEKYINALKNFTHEVNMRKPNLYVYPYVDSYLDAPTSSSHYMIETESIPFIQMVLSGYTSFYSSPLNLNYLGEKQLLELVDYNISPSYLLTEEDTMNLIDSPASSYIYSSIYDVWKDEVVNSYQKVINVLKQVEGQIFLKREQIAPNVYLNTYENKAIVINYGDTLYDYNGHEVLPLSSEVIAL